MAYGTAEGVWVAAIPEGCAAGDAGALVSPARPRPTGDRPTSRPRAHVERRRTRQRRAEPPAAASTATLTTGVPGRATLTAVLKRRTIAKRKVDRRTAARPSGSSSSAVGDRDGHGDVPPTGGSRADA